MADKFKYVFEFNSERVDGKGEWKDILGGKGAGLAGMSLAGLPVPPGFTISTEACSVFLRDQDEYAREVLPEVHQALQRLEAVSGKGFGANPTPLLVSVRSGARFSMPGMMDTVLNIGLNDTTVRSLAQETANPRFAYDSYRRLLQMFGDVVLGLEDREFERTLARIRERRGVRHEIELSAEDLAQICEDFKNLIVGANQDFPQDPEEQLKLAITAVFRSWNNPRAVTYRKLNEIPEDLGTAVNVQAMVFGNRGTRSGSGVGFTRNPSTGEKRLYGEYLPQAQGEEVVAGTRTPLPFSELEKQFPEIHQQLLDIAERLETRYREMQDFEFTMEDGKLYMLQTRDGKRTGLAAVRIALEMVREGLIRPEEALLRVKPEQLDQLLHPVFKETDLHVIATGLPASPGAAVGKLVFTADDAVLWSGKGEDVILARAETTPDDIHGMEAAEGILTSRGGMTSHAAVVARGMGKCSVVGCEDLQIDEDRKEMRTADLTLHEGDLVSLDGGTGRVILGAVEKSDSVGGTTLTEFLEMVEEVPSMSVRANADTPRDARKAREFGAVGIGLCRTEHMFFGEERLPVMQEMVVAENRFERERALTKLKEFQREDFYAILQAMDGLPVTVRLLDPPLHEFLPSRRAVLADISRLRTEGGSSQLINQRESLLRRIDELEEVNPMLGHRGCRLGITYPEITRMQVEALFEAACRLKKEGKSPVVEVMIPLVGYLGEFTDQATLIRNTAQQTLAREAVDFPYLVGTMIELPRAALVADQLAQESEFFSFGTNDLTQTTLGFSRDDAARFVKIYQEKKILARDPFQSIDLTGVGQLVQIACERARGTRPGIKLGICGEHGGDPRSVNFFNDLDLDYVSCSPFRVPGARLAAAQARIRQEGLAG